MENKQAEQKQSIPDATTVAHTEAEKDIQKDPELDNKPAPADGLDEGELARLEGEE